MSEATHTPVPWRCDYAGHLYSSGEGYVAIITPFTPKEHHTEYGGATPKARANARFIVRAVNAHEKLVEACKRVLTAIEWSTTADRMESEEQAELLRAALALAEGEN